GERARWRKLPLTTILAGLLARALLRTGGCALGGAGHDLQGLFRRGVIAGDSFFILLQRLTLILRQSAPTVLIIATEPKLSFRVAVFCGEIEPVTRLAQIHSRFQHSLFLVDQAKIGLRVGITLVGGF